MIAGARDHAAPLLGMVVACTVAMSGCSHQDPPAPRAGADSAQPPATSRSTEYVIIDVPSRLGESELLAVAECMAASPSDAPLDCMLGPLGGQARSVRFGSVDSWTCCGWKAGVARIPLAPGFKSEVTYVWGQTSRKSWLGEMDTAIASWDGGKRPTGSMGGLFKEFAMIGAIGVDIEDGLRGMVDVMAGAQEVQMEQPQHAPLPSGATTWMSRIIIKGNLALVEGDAVYGVAPGESGRVFWVTQWRGEVAGAVRVIAGRTRTAAWPALEEPNPDLPETLFPRDVAPVLKDTDGGVWGRAKGGHMRAAGTEGPGAADRKGD
jgi:hypothetical protein